MKDKQSSLVKQILICILILYAVFTAVPAIIHYALKGDILQEASSAVSSSAESESVNDANSSELNESSSLETDSGESSENSEDSAANEVPGFLDDMILNGTAETTATGDVTSSDNEDVFEIYDTATDTVLTVSSRDFLPAAVICEMPLSAPDEALKAQAVAAYSYYVWQRESGNTENADFTCDTENWLVYVTNEQLQERWGEDYESNYAKIKGITDTVYGELLTSGGAAICSTYFAISNGSTEASENVWGGTLPYLQAVASPGDKLSDGYLSTKSFSVSEMQELLDTAFPEASFDFSISEETWFQDQQLSSAGYTQTINVCGISVSGTDLRSALSLSSTCFTVTYDGLYFVFTVHGRGHGVGMSQAGAMFMAQQGSSYQEILSHYYPGSELTAS